MNPVCILGPTASGKSGVAMSVAAELDRVELISVDSMQVYRGMDIGTAKPSRAEQERVRHHLIDLADPADEFTVSMFQSEWFNVRDALAARQAKPLLVGGTGLYLRAVVDSLELPGRYPDAVVQIEETWPQLATRYRELERLDPTGASRIDPNNERRITRALEVAIGSGRPFSSFGPGLEAYPDVPFQLIGLRIAPAELDARINARYDEQMRMGFVDEVRLLSQRPAGIGRTARQALGYRELLQHVEVGASLDEMLDVAKLRTRRFARKQMRWYRRDPRIEWFDLEIGSDGQPDYRAVVAHIADALR